MRLQPCFGVCASEAAAALWRGWRKTRREGGRELINSSSHIQEVEKQRGTAFPSFVRPSRLMNVIFLSISLAARDVIAAERASEAGLGEI